MIDQRIQDVIDLNNLSRRSLQYNLIASGHNATFRKSCGQGIDVFVCYPEKIDQGDVI
jgi:hypothetical protein